MGDVSPVVVAFAGHAGAGKTTAAEYLTGRGFGSIAYIGRYITDEVKRRGLPDTQDSEREIRLEVRGREGMAAFARRALPDIATQAARGPVLIDAIYNKEEWELYLEKLPAPPFVIGIRASQGIRAERLVTRPERPMTLEELIKRDHAELDKLHLGEVLDQADETLTNEASEGEFHSSLEALVSALFR